MARIIHTATGPNGERFKRTSATRRYEFVVIARASYEGAKRVAHRRHARDLKDYADRIKWAAEGYEPAAWMYNTPDYKDPTRSTAERFREEGRISAIEWLRDKPATAQEYADAELAKALAGIEASKAAGRFDVFEAQGWSGKRHLAERAAAQLPRDYHEGITVIPVDPA